jgi:two-component system response regulator FlrC
MSHSGPANAPALPPGPSGLPVRRRRVPAPAPLPQTFPLVLHHALAWPGLAAAVEPMLADRCPRPVVRAGQAHERPDAPHVYLEPGVAPAALLEGRSLRIVLSSDADRSFALGLIAAFLQPGHLPAALAPASRALLALAARVAAHDVPVLIEGATGTGKEGLARFIHERSPRRGSSLVAVNCAALPETMLEAALFGHERGAFTGAVQAGPGLFREADGGTLLLDEVAELPLALQAKLLRALQEREVMPVGATRPVPVDVRVVACGNRDLAGEVAAGRFRADLYYRLAVFPLATLPLAARIADVPAIAAAWLLRRASERAGGAGPVHWLDASALAALMAHDWPGNVRELGNALDRAMVMADGPAIGVADLQLAAAVRPAMAAALQPVAAAPLAGRVRAEEARVIADALAVAPNRRMAAQRLGISERTLRYKLAGLATGGVRPASALLQ